MNRYTVELLYKVDPHTDVKFDHVMEQLFKNGLDDALIGTGRSDRLAIETPIKAPDIFSSVAVVDQVVTNVIQNAELVKIEVEQIIGYTNADEFIRDLESGEWDETKSSLHT